MTQLAADRRQRALFFEAEEELHRAKGRCGEDHRPTGETVRLVPNPGRGSDGGDFVSGAAIAGAIERLDLHNLGFRKNTRPMLLCQVEIIKIQRILCSDNGNRSCNRRRRCRLSGQDLLPRRMGQEQFRPAFQQQAERYPPWCSKRYARLRKLLPLCCSRWSAGPRILFSVIPNMRAAVS